jgi:hypothetical protein
LTTLRECSAGQSAEAARSKIEDRGSKVEDHFSFVILHFPFVIAGTVTPEQ